MNAPEVKKVKCPTCGKYTEFSSKNSFRPFCSDRCRLIDLGQWADESYKIPVVNQTPQQWQDIEDNLNLSHNSENDMEQND